MAPAKMMRQTNQKTYTNEALKTPEATMSSRGQMKHSTQALKKPEAAMMPLELPRTPWKNLRCRKHQGVVRA